MTMRFASFGILFTASCFQHAEASGRYVRSEVTSLQVEASTSLTSSASLTASADRIAAELKSRKQFKTATAAECMNREPTNCQTTDGCMWHESNCVPRPSNPGLHCYNGSSWTPCFNAADCAKTGPSKPTADAKWAFVWTNSAPQDMHELPEMNIRSQIDYARQMGNMDVILIIPKVGAPIDGMGGTAQPMPELSRKRFVELGVLIQEVDWALPPGMLYLPRVPWCGSKDFMRLHVMGLAGYAAVVYTDFDVQLMGMHEEMKDMFSCAAQNHVLWTGDVLGPINIGVFAARPSPALREAGVILAQTADFSTTTGWGDAGLAPFTGAYIGAECGQGFYKTMFFQQEFQAVKVAMQQAGAESPKAHMVDLCKWNYLHGWECPKEYPCEDVVFIHKDSMDKGGCRQRQQYGFYLHVHGQPAATLKQIRDVRDKYRNAPVYIMSDGGMNFSKACDEIQNCLFSWKPPANDRWNPKPFFDRFREAARWLDSEYVVMLEPDVTLHSQIQRLPKADAGGLRDTFNRPLSHELRKYLEEVGRKTSGRSDFKLMWKRFGLAGGSIFRTEAALKAFRAEKIDWSKVQELEDRRVYSSDIAMAIALAVHGFSYFPWDEVKTGPHSSFIETQPKHSTAFQHHGSDEPGGRPLYDKQLTGKDVDMVTEGPTDVVAVTCQHCIWGEDSDCFPRQSGGKISCPITPPALGMSLLQQVPEFGLNGDWVSYVGSSNMLVVSTALQDGGYWGSGGVYPKWIQKILPNTADLAKKHDHTHVVRTHLTAPTPEWAKHGELSFRELANWEKLKMLDDYLATDRYTHMLFLDADATFAHADRDTVKRLAGIMDDKGASLLLADEDWNGPKESGPTKLNGGVLMVKNTQYAKKLVKAFLAAHQDPRGTGWGGCASNEQLCLRSFLEDTHHDIKFEGDDEGGRERSQHMLVLSGTKFNRNPDSPCKLTFEADKPCNSDDVEIVHFMGRSKDFIDQYGMLLQEGEGHHEPKGMNLLSLFPLMRHHRV